MNKTAFVRSVSAATILGLSLTTTGGVAVAQEEPNAAVSPVIDPNAPVTLTIDKRLNPTQIGAAGTGQAVDSGDIGNPLQGATFTGTLLNVDAVAPENLGKLTASNFEQLGATTTGTTVSGTTDGNGQVKFDRQSSQITQGIWLFTETITGEVTDVVTSKKYQASEVAPSSPFIVSLPYTNPEGDGWNYNVVVQPKNTTSGITKTVDDADKNVGDTISYTVKGDVPVIPTGDKLKGFRLEDTLDTDNLSDINAQVVLSNGVELIQNDYELSIDQNTGKVTVTFTDTGLRKLSNQPAGTTVDLTITATVKTLAGTDGIAVNKAKQFVHYPNQEEERETESNEVKSYWGQVKVVKTAEAEEGQTAALLSGAEFELYRCAGDETQADELDGEKITINGTSKWTTNDQGNVVIDGLHVTNIENHSNQIEKSYCLVETKAPRGFVATNEVHSFKLVSNDEKLNSNEPVQYEAQIKNKRSEMPQLPLTGGMGIGLLAALAALVAGLAAWFARRASSKA